MAIVESFGSLISINEDQFHTLQDLEDLEGLEDLVDLEDGLGLGERNRLEELRQLVDGRQAWNTCDRS